MIPSSEVKLALDDISRIIAEARAVLVKAKSNASNAVVSLNDIPTTFAGALETINGYGTTDAFEALCKAELAKLTTEFVDLMSAGTTIAQTDVH